jgi:pyruvate formate lyase activating enzyme
MVLPIKGLQKLSLIDYPGKLCATVFVGGCNFHCVYCYNVDLVLRPEKLITIPEEEVLTLLSERKGFLDGVCVGAANQPSIRSYLLFSLKSSPLVIQ